MKYLVAAAAGLVIFVLSFLLLGFAADEAIPPGWKLFSFKVWRLNFNEVSLLSLIGASLAAAFVVKACLPSKSETSDGQENVEKPRPDRYRFQ